MLIPTVKTGQVQLQFALWQTLDGLTFDAAGVRILFVALAALAVPHMVLIERVRMAGWSSSASVKFEYTSGKKDG